MAETTHNDMISHLEEEKRALNDGLNKVYQLRQFNGKFTATAKTELVAAVKLACGHSSCPVADNYKGNEVATK